MFFKVTAILLLSIEYLLASENSTIVQSLQSPEPTTSFGNTTTRNTETTENASNFVTESLLNISNPSHQLHPEPKIAIEPNENSLNSLKPRGKTKFIFHNTVQHALNNREVPRNEITNQDQNDYSIEQQLDDLQQRQQLQLATAEKEEFIQSELHNLAKDIAETELNREAGKTINNNSRPSSWKSFFSSIFPQGIMNVFHLSVTAEPSQKSKTQTIISEGRTITSNEAYEGRKIVPGLSTLPITPPLTMTTQLLITPPLPTVSTIPSVEESVPSVLPTEIEETQQNGTVMTNKDVFDINSAAEVSEMPFETVIPMESSNIFHIHPLNCEENCAEESPEDYIDGEQLSESGDDNIVAFSRESPQNIFYPTPKPDLPYPGVINQLRNTDVYYSGTGPQTSEEIVRENMKNFGQKIPPVYHPAKQLDDFQKEVEKQFDHNEVRIDAEAASRKFLKYFKGKYVKPQDSTDSTQSSTFKGINHFELIASTLRPEINFLAQPSPVKPESQLHTYIYSAGFKPDSPPKSETSSDSLSNYKTFGGERNVKIENDNGPSQGEKSSNSQNFFLPYPNNSLKPESLLHTYIYSAQQNSSSNSNTSPETPKPETKEINENSPNQTGNRYTNIYSKTDPNDNKNENPQNDNENNVQLYSTNLKPESLLHTYIYSAHDKFNNNSISSKPSESERSSKSEDISFSWVSNKPGQVSKPPSTGKTYLCSSDQLKTGDCAYSTTFSPNDFYQPKDIIEIQKSYETQVKHTKPYVYYTFPPSQQPMLSKNPIRVEQAEDSQQSESLIIPESYQQRQQYLQDQQKQLNQQQEYFQHHQIQQYQQKLQYQQQQKYIQDQQKQQKQLEEYQQKQQLQLQQYQQQQQNQQQQYEQLKQQQQVEQQYQQQQQYFQQKQQQQQEKQQQEQFLQVQQQQHNQQQMQKYQQQQMQYYQQQQQQHQQQQEQQKKEQEQKKLIKYNTVKVEKIVPKPYPVPVKEIVEKIVERPVHVEHIVEKPVNVPYPVREVVEKIVDRPYPVEKIIDRPVHIPYPVQVDHFIDRPYAVRVPVPVAVPVPVHQYIDRPYPVEKIIEKPIHVPYPVDKIVEKIVEKHIPVEVERIVEKPAPTKKPVPKKPLPVVHTVSPAKNTKHKINPEELLELVPPPVDQAVHDGYKTLPDDIEFILIDDYNGPVPSHDNQGYQWNKPEKRATAGNHNIKRSPEFRRNLRVEYGFRPPLIPSVEIGEKGLI
ncbi:uncharacterized protein LOC129918992 [Episyrphus balteatus]|uniref:uncharacterized protein LOC129918992 n=1 Tax=Episyrphus balteatus TaxID=286459 RepID=UPI0024859A91|nr:uncharacterized protein LOC129918992 [Episyrphus balteatus]